MGEIEKYLSKIGRRGGRIGGKSKSKAKLKAVRANMKKAAEARRKYPPCPQYANRSHRFSRKTGKCYGCGYTKRQRNTKRI